MQDSKRTIIRKTGKSIVFLVVLAGILLGMSGWITRISGQDDSVVQTRNKNLVKIQKEPEDTIDVVFLGDSLGYTSFSPMQMWEEHGFTSYAGCQSGQQIQESYTMLKTAFEKQKPRVAVLETNVIFRDQKGVSGIQQMLAERFIEKFPVFRFHDIWKPMLMGKQYVEDNYKGFVIRSEVAPYKGRDYMKKSDGKREISEGVRRYLSDLQELCEENGTELILVSTPSPLNYNYQKHNALREYADENGLRYLDLNLMTKELKIDWAKDSLDKGDHPNLAGAKKISAYMGAWLSDTYKLEDHRGDPSYSAWDQEAETYENKISRQK